MRRASIAASHLGLVALLGLAACRGGKSPEGPDTPDASSSKAQVAAAAAGPQGAGTGPDPVCITTPSATPEEKLTIGGKTWQRRGTTLSLEGSDADDEFVVGQITDIKDYSPDNASNIAAIAAWLKSEQVDAIILTGDLGETRESIEKVLRDVARNDVLVMAVIGNRECREHFQAAVQSAQRDFKNIINLNQVRVVNTDDVSFVSLPGYYNASYLHCATGCGYTREDVNALAEVAKAATAPIKALVTHGPPRQGGSFAIDRMQPENANVGDPDLAAFLVQNKGLFPVGLFGNIQEAGGYAVNVDGSARVPSETYVDSLYLNPGPADAVRWAMNDGSESTGMAGLVKFKGKQAMYKVFRLRGAKAPPASDGPATPQPALDDGKGQGAAATATPVTAPPVAR